MPTAPATKLKPVLAPEPRVGLTVSFDAEVLAAIRAYQQKHPRQFRSTAAVVNFHMAKAMGLDPHQPLT